MVVTGVISLATLFFTGKKILAPGADYHYHTGMNAGDNTLEALLLGVFVTLQLQMAANSRRINIRGLRTVFNNTRYA